MKSLPQEETFLSAYGLTDFFDKSNYRLRAKLLQQLAAEFLSIN